LRKKKIPKGKIDAGSKEYRSRKNVAEATAGGANAVFWSLTHGTKLGGILKCVQMFPFTNH
jgi:hypothetical protein